MAVYDLEEQEQISQLKAWWETYGKYVTFVIVAAALASVAWQGWNWYRSKQAAEAGALYYVVQQAVERGDAAKAREASGEILDKYKGTAYAEMAALLSARAQFGAGDFKNAQAQLQWAVDNANDPLLKDFARLRLATVLLEQGEFKAGLATLDGAPPHALLQPRFADLRGDLLAGDAQLAEARKAYQAALESLIAQGGVGSALHEAVRLKLQSLEA